MFYCTPPAHPPPPFFFICCVIEAELFLSYKLKLKIEKKRDKCFRNMFFNEKLCLNLMEKVIKKKINKYSLFCYDFDQFAFRLSFCTKPEKTRSAYRFHILNVHFSPIVVKCRQTKNMHAEFGMYFQDF